MIWETVIGLEVHAQLKTQSKLFSGASTAYGASPNSQTSFIDAGLPGVLPVLNQEAVRMAVLFGLAIDATIHDLSYFERKNYFYPDLPKGYQISQYKQPIVSHGHLTILTENGHTKKVEIARAHLEEDAGKSLHEAHEHYTGIDLNRAGTPLLEIVTTPCLYSAAEAIAYLKCLHQLLRFLAICDGNMQEGSFRCDVNISLRPQGSETLGTRTELKNLNSFRFIEKAIQYEQYRHQDMLEQGETMIQETRLYSPADNATYSMRDKENDNDYRYFPDPDLLPIRITVKDLKTIKASLPALPAALKQRLMQDDQLTKEDVQFLLTSPAHLAFFDQIKQACHAPTKIIVNWLRGHYAALLNERGLTFDTPPVAANDVITLLNYVTAKTITASQAKVIFAKLATGDRPLEELITEYTTSTVQNHDQLQHVIQQIIRNYPQQVADYRAGKEKLLAFFIGHVMKAMKGSADPVEVSTLLSDLLRSRNDY